jgi:transglutaminase-like putative cysteine protease
MYYTIRHVTHFRYSSPIAQSVTEVRMQPRTEGYQRCLNFALSVNPTVRVLSYRDYLGNIVHHFDLPGQHRSLSITAEAQVEMHTPSVLPDSLPAEAWDELSQADYDWLLPSHFTYPSPLLSEFAAEIGVERRADPMTLLRELMASIYGAFEYAPDTTKVDSPIDDALRVRQGVCQDFTHIMLALVRPLGIPCRYVSGYLFHRSDIRSAPDASHAWVEALLPQVGWVGFDPTNNLIAGERHIRAAVGRDYADVPPTRGVFKGTAETELSVGVRVSLTEEPPTDAMTFADRLIPAPESAEGADQEADQQQ